LGQSKATGSDRAHFARQLEALIAALRAAPNLASRRIENGCGVKIRQKISPTAAAWRAVG
jgi:hypothetical protein